MINLVAIGWLWRWSWRRLIRGRTENHLLIGVLSLISLLLWWPIQQTVQNSQFCLVAVVALLAAFDRLDSDEWSAGLLLAIALIKPSLTLPFLIIPALSSRWKVLGVAVGSHVLATLTMSLFLRESPGSLIGQWLAVSRYFMQGMYSFHEVLFKLGLAGTLIGSALSLLLLGAGLLFVTLCRRAPRKFQFNFLVYLSLFFTYHGIYDFVLLYVNFVLPRSGTRSPFWGLAAFVVLDAGFWSTSMAGEFLASRILGWTCRLILLGLFLASGLLVVRSAWLSKHESGLWEDRAYLDNRS